MGNDGRALVVADLMTTVVARHVLVVAALITVVHPVALVDQVVAAAARGRSISTLTCL